MTSGNLRQWSAVLTIDMISSPCPFQRQTTLEGKAWAIHLDQTALQGETTFLKYPPLFWKTKARLHQMIPQIGEADATEKERRIDSSAIRGSSRCHWRCKDLITNLISPIIIIVVTIFIVCQQIAIISSSLPLWQKNSLLGDSLSWLALRMQRRLAPTTFSKVSKTSSLSLNSSQVLGLYISPTVFQNQG